MRLAGLGIVVAILAMTVGGCVRTSSSEAVAVVEGSAELADWEVEHPPGEDWDVSAGELEQIREEQIEKARESYRVDASVAPAEPVRTVSREEWPQVMADCLNERGFRYRPSQGGVVLAEPVSDDQAPLIQAAMFECSTMYPTDPRTRLPLPRVRAEMDYTYQVETVAPCLRDMGIDVPEAPSLETYLEQYYAQKLDWNPINSIYDVVDDPADADRYYQQCPPQAPGLYPESVGDE